MTFYHLVTLGIGLLLGWFIEDHRISKRQD